MNLEKPHAEIIVAYSGAHPAHQQMLADCCTRCIKMLGDWAPGKQLSNKQKMSAYIKVALKLRKSAERRIVIEGTTPAAIMAPIIKCCNTKPKTIIALCGEDTLYRAFIENIPRDRFLLKASFRYISGIIASGDLVARIANEHCPSLPIEIRYPQLSQRAIAEMSEVQPALESRNMVLIGSGSAYTKGADIAIQCLDYLKADFPDAKLIVIGKLDVKPHPGVEILGAVEDIRSYLSASSVLIHPGRGEAFGVAIVEAMLAGVVPFVSEWTGAASVVEKVAPRLIAPLQPEEFAERIAAHWHATTVDREVRSKQCRDIASSSVKQFAHQQSLLDFLVKL